MLLWLFGQQHHGLCLSNRAIAYGSDFDYVILEVLSSTDLISKGQRLMIAKNLSADFCQNVHIKDYTILGTFKGKTIRRNYLFSSLEKPRI